MYEPFFSDATAAGIRKISVLICCGRTLPSRTSGASCQKAAVSISWMSRTTSQSRFARPARPSTAFCPPTAGFWPMQNSPFMVPSFIIISMGWNE